MTICAISLCSSSLLGRAKLHLLATGAGTAKDGGWGCCPVLTSVFSSFFLFWADSFALICRVWRLRLLLCVASAFALRIFSSNYVLEQTYHGK